MKYHTNNKFLVFYDVKQFRFRLFKTAIPKSSCNYASTLSVDDVLAYDGAHECNDFEFNQFSDIIETDFVNKILNIDIVLTSKCNLQCVYCFAKDLNGQLPLNKAKTICDEINKSPVLHVTLSGGEPTLYPYLIDIIRMLDPEICITIDSNGTLAEIIKKNIPFFKERKNLNFRITIDNVSEEKIRIVRPSKDNINTLERIDDLIRVLHENNVNVMVQTVVTSKNINDLRSILNYLNERNIKRVNINKVLICDANTNKDLGVSNNDFLVAINDLLKTENDFDLDYSIFAYENSVILINPNGDVLTHNYSTGERIQIDSGNTPFLYRSLNIKNHYYEYFRQYNTTNKRE